MFGVTDRLTNQDIYERIYAAISERKLQPGTKLSEERLATVFHVSRTRIREVLFRLSQELIVDLHPNRGAFIASPTQADMQDVFQVRQALERGVVVHLCQTCPHPSVPSLQTGEFHLRLAEATGNRLFADNLRRLVALTGLIITQHGSQDSSVCTDQEHEDIVRAIEQGQPEQAARLMQDHLRHVEAGIKAMREVDTDTDFEAIFGLKKPVAVDHKV